MNTAIILPQNMIPGHLKQYFEKTQPCQECYICKMVTVFREVWRVLRPGGTLWLNIGDSYAGSANAGGDTTRTSDSPPNARDRHLPAKKGLKPKDLCMIPARLALALQANGWYLRSEIIWHKPNPMPESVTDRPTKAHEQIFLLSKSERYFYDAEAVKEESTASQESLKRYAYGRYEGNGDAKRFDRTGKPDFLTVQGQHYGEATGSRNLRTVWSLASEGYSGAHYACFPQALVERCIRAGTSQMGVCPQCRAPWVRETEKIFRPMTDRSPEKLARASGHKGIDQRRNDATTPRGYVDVCTTGWQPSCACNAGPPQPSIVLDCFAGSGTTGLVARALGRHAVLCDLSYPYLRDQARHRLSLDALAAWAGRNGHVPAEDHTTLPLFAPEATP